MSNVGARRRVNLPDNGIWTPSDNPNTSRVFLLSLRAKRSNLRSHKRGLLRFARNDNKRPIGAGDCIVQTFPRFRMMHPSRKKQCLNVWHERSGTLGIPASFRYTKKGQKTPVGNALGRGIFPLLSKYRCDIFQEVGRQQIRRVLLPRVRSFPAIVGSGLRSGVVVCRLEGGSQTDRVPDDREIGRPSRFVRAFGSPAGSDLWSVAP
jgi:hypothetical protein